MPPAYPADEIVMEGHEGRIQHLEQTSQKLVGQSTEALVKIDYLSKQVAETHESILDRIEKGFVRIAEDIEAHTKKIENMDDRLESIEVERHQEENKRASYRKFVSPLVIAGATVLVTKYAEQFWMWLSR